MSVLHHEVVAKPGTVPDKLMLVLHGIYGSGRNWRAVARRLTAERPDWRVVLVDLRCHGRSRGLPPPNSVQSCADDVLDLEQHLQVRADAVLGHSYGGKVALLHARLRRVGPRQLWLIDASPGAGRPGGSAWRMLDMLRRRPGPFSSRKAVRTAVEAEGFSPAMAAWMALNAAPDGDQRTPDGDQRTPAHDQRWTWRLDPGEMEALLRDYFRTDAWSVVEDPPAETMIHVVAATESNVLDTEAAARVQRAATAGRRVAFHEVVGGHWLNADNPQTVSKLLASRLP